MHRPPPLIFKRVKNLAEGGGGPIWSSFDSIPSKVDTSLNKGGGVPHILKYTTSQAGFSVLWMIVVKQVFNPQLVKTIVRTFYILQCMLFNIFFCFQKAQLENVDEERAGGLQALKKGSLKSKQKSKNDQDL